MSATQNLVEGRGRQPARQVGPDREAVAAVGRSRNERLGAQGEQIVLAHQTQHPLGVDDQALAAQRVRDAPIATMAVGQRDALDEVAQIRVVAGRGVRSEMAVIAGARHAAQAAQALNVRINLEKALQLVARLLRGHFLDDFVEVGAPLFGLFASQSRKASRKKCRSAC